MAWLTTKQINELGFSGVGENVFLSDNAPLIIIAKTFALGIMSELTIFAFYLRAKAALKLAIIFTLLFFLLERELIS